MAFSEAFDLVDFEIFTDTDIILDEASWHYNLNQQSPTIHPSLSSLTPPTHTPSSSPKSTTNQIPLPAPSTPPVTANIEMAALISVAAAIADVFRKKSN